MRILIRADSSSTIGAGHLTRCLTLAGQLHKNGAEVAFACRYLPGNRVTDVRDQDFAVRRIGDGSEDEEMEYILAAEDRFDWLIIDHYDYDISLESLVKKHADRVMVIDDLTREHQACDLLLDQNLYPEGKSPYNQPALSNCRKLIGPRYALLRDEFKTVRANLRNRDGHIRNILITMGGADPQNITAMALHAIELLDWPDLTSDVVVGPSNPRYDEIQKICSSLPRVELHHPAKDMADLMAKADLCLGTAGSTTWERCCLGLPTLFITSGDNEVEIARNAESAGIGKYLGRYDEIWPEMIADELNFLNTRPDILREWSDAARTLVDGLGAERVCRAIMEYEPVEAAS